MFAFTGAGEFATLAQAQQAMTGGQLVTEPSAGRDRYEALYARYRQVLADLSPFYGA